MFVYNHTKASQTINLSVKIMFLSPKPMIVALNFKLESILEAKSISIEIM